MRKINRTDVLRMMLVLTLVAGVGLAFGSVGRFVPTHQIVAPVFCGSCHPEQVKELSATTHLGKFAYELDSAIKNDAANGVAVDSDANTSAHLISGGCTMCHNYWENLKWFGVQDFNVSTFDSGDLGLPTPTDIYGNAVSPYGLGSTNEYTANVTYPDDNLSEVAIPWSAGLNTYEYKKNGHTYDRLDYVWSNLSAMSPGPVGFIKIKSTGKTSSCGSGSAEHGMCHFARDAVALTFESKKSQLQEFPNVNNGSNGGIGPGTGTGKFAGRGPSMLAIFFTHEMAFTTAQYAAKPVKNCGVCHVFKLPPMKWGGEPWAISDINYATSGVAGTPNEDPFGFRPTYNSLTGTANVTFDAHANTSEYQVMFRTPDWAHSNVPCIRCHAHAGINGNTVTDNGAIVVNDTGVLPVTGTQLIDPRTGAPVP